LEVRPETGLARKVQAENNNNLTAGIHKYQVGDEVFLVAQKADDGKVTYEVYDYNRLSPLFWLLIFFIVITVLVGRLQGLTSFLGMVSSFLVIFYLVLPQILAGHDAFLMAILAALIIVPVTFYLAHGYNRKTTAAIIGTMLTLVLVGLIAYFSVRFAHLTGTDSDEATMLMQTNPGVYNFQQLLMAGIIISLLGILNDITISQAAIVYKLKEVSNGMKWRELFTKAMDVGRDHIASVVNTLVLVYAGAALPLLMVFLKNPAPFAEVINEEFMAEEVVKTLVASLGIVIAVPLTTLVSAFLVNLLKEKLKKGSTKKAHLHDGHEH
jgi:uncharacterized membrane protein